MLERIKEILETKRLTPTQFADAIGVARPIVSHVLSGRNKPSLEVYQKIVDAFPDVDPLWLLRGVGLMLAEPGAAVVPPVAPVAPPALKRTAQKAPKQGHGTQQGLALEPDLPADATTPPEASVGSVVSAAPVNQQNALQATVASSVEQAPNYTMPLEVPVASDKSNTREPGETTALAGSGPEAPLLHAFSEPGKTIRRIVIFYHDGTFTDYQPER